MPGYVFSLKQSKATIDFGFFLSDFPDDPKIITENRLNLSWQGAAKTVKGVDKQSGITWEFDAPGLKKKFAKIDNLRDVELSKATGTFKDDGTRITFSIDGTEKNKNGTHPNLTLDVLMATEFDDLLRGDDVFLGSKQADTFYSGAGADVLKGFGGDDYLSNLSGQGVLRGGKGDDTLTQLNGDSKQFGGGGDDDLNGGFGGNSTLYGNSGDDMLRGDSGNDKLFGGSGDDSILGSYGDDIIKGGGQNDEMDGGSGDDRIFGQGGHDDLSGGDGDDVLKGGGGRDVLEGDAGVDVMYGGGGDDYFRFDDDEDSDTAYGGKGDDTFNFRDGMHHAYGGAGADVFAFEPGSVFSEEISYVEDFEDGTDLLRFIEMRIDSLNDLDYRDTGRGLRIDTQDGERTIFVKGLTEATFSMDDLYILPG